MTLDESIRRSTCTTFSCWNGGGDHTGLALRCNSGLCGHILRLRPAGDSINMLLRLPTAYGA